MNTRILTFSSFILAGMAIMGIFLTATTYTQLGIAIALYPVIIYLAFKTFPRGTQISRLNEAVVTTQPQVEIEQKVNANAGEEKTEAGKEEALTITDINKRAFLKLVGATGLSFFLISVFGRRVESLLVGQNLVQTPASAPINQTALASASPTDGYNISEIEDGAIGYYGFINKDGAWFIMKSDTNSGSYRYTRGKSDFPANWKKREQLEYDYFYKVFP